MAKYFSDYYISDYFDYISAYHDYFFGYYGCIIDYISDCIDYYTASLTTSPTTSLHL
jgi:hypothetical protein